MLTCRRQRQTPSDSLRLRGGEDNATRILQDMPHRILGYLGSRDFDPALSQEVKPIENRIGIRGALLTVCQKCEGLLFVKISVS